MKAKYDRGFKTIVAIFILRVNDRATVTRIQYQYELYLKKEIHPEFMTPVFFFSSSRTACLDYCHPNLVDLSFVV